jgi:hypothetical protein
MASAEYKKWRERFDSTGRIDPLELGQTRKEIEDFLGTPDDTSVPPRNKRLPQIFKYEEMELHFENGIEGGLHLIFEHSKDGYVSTSIKKQK